MNLHIENININNNRYYHDVNLSPTNATELNDNGTLMDIENTLAEDKSEINDAYQNSMDQDTQELAQIAINDKESFTNLINKRISRFDIVNDHEK